MTTESAYRNPSPRHGKVERLSAKTALLAEGNFVLPASAPWLSELRHELVAFPEGRHDDLVDALVVFLEFVYDSERWILTRFDEAGRPVRPERRPGRRARRYSGAADRL